MPQAYQELEGILNQDQAGFRQDFGGLEDLLLGRATGPRPLYGEVGSDVGQAFNVSRGIQSRNAERYGLAVPGRLASAQQRTQGLGQALGQVQGVSTARLADDQREGGLLAGLGDIGSNLYQSGLSNLGNLASIFSQEESARIQARAAKRAGRRQRRSNNLAGGLSILMAAI